jgi:hypothetical protein
METTFGTSCKVTKRLFQFEPNSSSRSPWGYFPQGDWPFLLIWIAAWKAGDLQWQ